jgi:hypothetical protein
MRQGCSFLWHALFCTLVVRTALAQGEAAQPPKPLPTADSKPLESERIQSRLVQLYYFRDEKRVAEIISQNLTTQTNPNDSSLIDQLNKVRDAADDTAVQRRVAEVTLKSLARQSAEQADANSLVSLTSNGPTQRPITPEEIAAVEELRKLERQEQNLRTRQFLLESQLEDSKSLVYSMGDANATDPLSQVTLHAVGKGQLHLRGPLAGINKMARMIHQIDKPVGQVKVGIYTIQVSLNPSVKLDDVNEMIEQHVNHARFLSFQTALLFRQAVDKVASDVAGNRGGRSFAEDFFCDYFVKEMGRVEGHHETGMHALQTLGSFNSLNLIGSLYLASLAEDSVRQKILDEFITSVKSRVPDFELDYCRSLRTHSRSRIASGILMSRFQKRPIAISESDIREHAREKLRFVHLHDLFRSQDTGSDSYNSVQAATIELLLGLKRLRIAELELSNLRLERSLAQHSAATHPQHFDAALVDQFIDEQEALVVDLRDTLRSAVAGVDSQLKQMAIAFEEDIQAQFYKPAFTEIRRAAENWQVSLGQIETTTVITNDRTIAKVSPGQTTQLDLPKRQTLIGETANVVTALTGETRSVAARFGSQSVGGPAGSAVADAANVTQPPGASLEKLIPRPDVYTFEAGNQFEITPIIQPDGESIAYEFIYTYANDVSEGGDPGDPGFSRIKRHFVKTEVQSASYELREISRFRIALNARRQGRGVTLLSDLPLVGFLTRPLPSLGYSHQENIILADCVVYPTIFNLIGNDWLHPIEESTPADLLTEERKLLARRDQIRTQLLSISRVEAEAILKRIEGPTLTMPQQPAAPQLTDVEEVAEELPTFPPQVAPPRKEPQRTAEKEKAIKRTSFEGSDSQKSVSPADSGWQKSRKSAKRATP